MKSWVAQGADLETRLAGHEDVSTASVSRPGASRRRTRRLEVRVDAEQFKHDTTAKLVAELTAFLDPIQDRLARRDEVRLAFAESVERETIGKYETQWAEAIRSISDQTECPRYHGLRSRPRSG